MRVMILGGSGFVGQALALFLLDRGNIVTAVGRRARVAFPVHSNFRYISADMTQGGTWQKAAAQADILVNFTGRSIFGRWTKDYKKQIYNSRILSTRNLVQALPENCGQTLLNASAVGYYGDRGDTALTEDTANGTGFLAEIGRDWEAEALEAQTKNVRVVLIRFGIVLGRQGGAFAKMVTPFKLGLGGPLGTGKQWFPWIHLDDVAAAIQFLIDSPQAKGPFNFCAPNSVRNAQFTHALGRALHRPAFIPLPAVMMRIGLGEFASALLASHRAIPAKLQTAGFEFQFETISEALADLVRR